MSRAFLKNESADDPVVIPARAPLPPGVTNYVTPAGLTLLRTELDSLEAERVQAHVSGTDETERTRQLALLNGRIAQLNQRIASAKVVDTHNQPRNEVRFGATVSLQSRHPALSAAKRVLTIVGVDEADAARGRIAFTAPLARVLLGHRVGETVSLRTASGENALEIMGISYED